jgi:adenylate cyclase class IV
LKLRRTIYNQHYESERVEAELIAYDRETVDKDRQLALGVRTPVQHYDQMLDVLSCTLGVTATLEKTRHLFFKGDTRIHLDEVAIQGGQERHFLELEAVLSDGYGIFQSNHDGHVMIKKILSDLKLDNRPNIFKSYAEFLSGGQL